MSGEAREGGFLKVIPTVVGAFWWSCCMPSLDAYGAAEDLHYQHASTKVLYDVTA
jgi:hypothetical protein